MRKLSFDISIIIHVNIVYIYLNLHGFNIMLSIAPASVQRRQMYKDNYYKVEKNLQNQVAIKAST